MKLRAISVFLGVPLLFIITLVAHAHGTGTPQLLNAPAGPYLLSVWTDPDPLRTDEAHVVVAVVEPATQEFIVSDVVVTVRLRLLADPTVELAATAEMCIRDRWDADGQPIDGAGPVTLRGDMNHAGMKPVLADATGTGGGQYTADFEWTMAGDWTVAVEATLPDGRVKRATFPFTVEAVE